MLKAGLLLCFPQPIFELRDLARQAFGKMATESGEVLPYQGHFCKPALHVYAEQPGEIRGRKVESLRIQIRGLGKLANRRIDSVRLVTAALEYPLQHTAV